MKQVLQEEGSRPIKIWTDQVEDSAIKQLKNIARLPFIHHNGVACMPDVHAGIGATVGTVIATDKAIIPAAVGVDIGCGMNAVRLSLKASDLPDDLKKIRLQIERDVPLGAKGSHRRPETLEAHAKRMNAVPHSVAAAFSDGDTQKALNKAVPQLGTLGSGNHFIELCIDENQDVWIMLHSGSRGLGNIVGHFYMEKAKRQMEQQLISLPDEDLAYFPEDTDDFNAYVEAVGWAQNYALENRRVMMETVIAAIRRHIPIDFTITQEAINCFPGDTDVSAIDVKTAYKRHYDGEVVTLTTKSGRRLTVTPNHPILANTGWVRASDIQVGNNLVGAVRASELGSGINPDVDDVPAQFAQLFDALSVNSTTRRVVGSAVNFHGDVAGSVDDREVDVVGGDRMLSYGSHSSFLKQLRELDLLSSDLTESDGFGQRLLSEFVIADGSVSTSLVGAGGQSTALIGSQGLHAVSQSTAPTACLDASVVKELCDTGCADASISGKSIHGSSFGIALDEVVDVVRGHFSGHVYNLSTESGWYFANGIISHNCHHNYVEKENHFGRDLWITRKGAIRARPGDLGIIPGSMGVRSYIVAGKGNLESYCSCSHGAGRIMSRNEAKQRFTVDDVVTQTEGVECRKDSKVIDEIPGAYKNIDEVMANQTDLVEVRHTLKQVLNVKGV